MDLLYGYLLLNCLLTLGAGFGYLVTTIAELPSLKISARQVVRTHFGLIGLCFSLLLASHFLPETGFDRPGSQTFDPIAIKLMVLPSFQVLPPYHQNELVPTLVSEGWLMGALALVMMFLTRIGILISRTMTMVQDCFVYKTSGQVSVLLSDRYRIPFVFSFLQRSYVVLPSVLVRDYETFRTVLQHEFQHIRNKDTATIYLLEVLKALCFWNPFVYFWIALIESAQEFSCDEALLAQRGIHPRKYATCLLEVANLQGKLKQIPFGATGILFDGSKSQLFRRIERMKDFKDRRRGIMFSTVMGLLAATTLSLTTVTAKSFASLGEFTEQKLTSLVDPSKFHPDFPITINPAVVDQINRLTQTKKGRDFAATAFANFKKQKDILQEHIDKYGFPEELLAIGFVESAFRNLPPSNNPMRAAGIWQFIPQTAQKYNLTVSGDLDERLNINLETDAAMRYLGAMNLRFQNWQLAVLSYNAGENKVQRGINQTGSRNAWQLIAAGYEGDSGYLAKVMAAAIIMKYPSLVD